MNIPKEGSKWASSNNVFVVVLHTIDLDDHTWVHYRKESSEQEYSCYVESFLERFTPVL
jgi:hypothetical protein